MADNARKRQCSRGVEQTDWLDRLPQGMETCALCEEDDSVDEEEKRHVYTVGHLREHVASDFLTPYKQWIRRTHQDRDARMVADANDRDFTCPYYLGATGNSETFKAMKKLTLNQEPTPFT